jgi:hypothetical protein
MSEALDRARSLAEQGELKAALKQLERARRAAVAAGDEGTLGELLALADSIQARASGKEDRDASGGSSPLDDTAHCRYPAWAPTGARIATTCGDIVVIDPPDLTETDLHIASDDRPAWSPDGKQLAFYDDSTKRLDVIEADGSGRRTVAVVY